MFWAITTPSVLEYGLTWAIKRCAPEAVCSNVPPQGFTDANQGVDRLGDARLGCHPLLQQSLEAIDIELCEQQAECCIRRRVGDVGGEQPVECLTIEFGITFHPEQRNLVAEHG